MSNNIFVAPSISSTHDPSQIHIVIAELWAFPVVKTSQPLVMSDFHISTFVSASGGPKIQVFELLACTCTI